MVKDKETAKNEGFKRGLAGKADAAGLMQGWTDDKAAGMARNEGYVEGKRRRWRLEAEKRVKDQQ